MSEKELPKEMPEKENTIEENEVVSSSEPSEDPPETEEKVKKEEEKTVVSSEDIIEKDEVVKSSKTSEFKTKNDDDDDEAIVSSEEIHEEPENEVDENIKKEYHTLSESELISELKKLVSEKPIQSIKNEVEEIRVEFSSKFNEELEASKEKFLAEGGNIIDFHYSSPSKKEFNSVYFNYKEKRNHFYENLKKDLKANLQKRKELIEELKGLLNAEESINTTYKHFKDIQERWFEAGAIPKDKYNLIWNTYDHHVENFYDFLHLNREFRDLDFKHNLEHKLRLIIRAKELAQEENINKAFRELQMLHKMWKEEIGPVAKEYRDEIWDKFSEATKIIHDKRFIQMEALEKEFEVNFESKKQIIDEINSITQKKNANHKEWQNAIKEVQSLRDTFFSSGKVPKSKNKEIWDSFKETTRNFNKDKNTFYKDQKKEQFTNLEKKLELIKIAEDNKDNDDFDVVTPLMKEVQNSWKKIGHVPKKDSDKIWKQFKNACNHYFDKLHSKKNEANKEELTHFTLKEEFLASLNEFTLEGNHENDLALIKDKINSWKKIGRVPYNKKDIEQKFNKKLDSLFNQLDIDKKEIELIKFENKLNTLASEDDIRKLQNEEFFLGKKVSEVQNEIRQLENNLGFFQHVDKNNPMVKEVYKNIDTQKDQLDVWKRKLSKIRKVRKGL
ncbi:MAG: hypothetical protein ACI9SJ_000993 [Flavobacteriaceae bacterium]|jgi:hypothetical protein|uniref:DUF349 domain-containing protein n=1 Tax=Candidatus Marifrigoribacter sp. Uisw_064 TaxID=3230970 RepID=UPI003AE7D2A7